MITTPLSGIISQMGITTSGIVQVIIDVYPSGSMATNFNTTDIGSVSVGDPVKISLTMGSDVSGT